MKLFPLLVVVLSACLLTCGGHSPTPAQVTNAIITCTETVCTAKAISPECAQLEGAVLGCITSGGNVAVCLAGIPALVGVGYADVVCIVAALATPPVAGSKYAAMATSDVQTKASDWLKTQRISIKQ
jgi:hypothetical protein